MSCACGSDAHSICANCAVTQITDAIDVPRETARALAAALLPDLFDAVPIETEQTRERLTTLFARIRKPVP